MSVADKLVVHLKARELHTRLETFLGDNGVYTFTRGQSNIWQFVESVDDETVWGSDICWRVMKSQHCLAFFYAYPEAHASYLKLREFAVRNALFFAVDVKGDYMEGLINYICDTSYSRSSMNTPLRSLSPRQIRLVPYEWMVEYLKVEVYDFTLLNKAQQEAHVMDVVRRKEFLLLDFKGNRGMFELLEANPACMVYMYDSSRRKIDFALYVLSKFVERRNMFSGSLQSLILTHFLGPMTDGAYAQRMVHSVMTPLQSYDTFLCGFTPSRGSKRQKKERVFLPEEILRTIFQFAGYPSGRRTNVEVLQSELAIRNPNYAKGLSDLRF